MDIAAANFFLNLAVVLKNWIAGSTATKAEKRQILEAFEKALVETEIYIKSVERNSGKSDHMAADASSRNRQEEENLIRLWRAVSAKARGLDESVANIAYAKSKFWMDRDNWTRVAVVQNGISIKDAKEVILKLKI